MPTATLDRDSAAKDPGRTPQDPGAEGAGEGQRAPPLPQDVAIALLEAERDFLAEKVRDLGAERVQALEALSQKWRELEARYQENARAARRLEEEGARLDRRLLRLNEGLDSLQEAMLRHLALHHRTRSRVRLPWKLRWLKVRRPHRWGALYRIAKDYELLARSPLFDRRWYLHRNPDVAASGMDPLLHYLTSGFAEGRPPGPDFDVKAYVRANPDVVEAVVNPLVHLLRHGIPEGRRLVSSSARVTQALEPVRRAVRPARRRPRLWFYLGDTLEWLGAHAQLTGVGHVSSELFFAFAEQAAEAPILPCVLDPDTSRLVEVSLPEQYLRLSRNAGRPPSAAIQRLLVPGGAAARSPEAGDHVFFTGLVWTPTFTELFGRLAAAGVELSVLVHDIIPIEQPELAGDEGLRSFSEWLGTVFQTASAIYVSGARVEDKLLRWALLSGVETRPAIVRIPFGVRSFEGAPPREGVARDPRTSGVAVDSFVLSVGTIDRRKNQAFLCGVWRRLLETLGAERTPQLVLVGRNDERLGAPGSEFADLAATGKLLVLEGLSDAQLAGLYASCRFTAFPSLSEGYGLPVAESLGCGRLCLASELPEIRQHAGDLCWYFSPTDAEGALATFVRAVTDDAARGAAEAKIAREFRGATWADGAREMARVALAPPPGSAESFTPGVQRPSFPGALEVDPTAALARAGRWCTDVDPEVSILIVNWNAASLTLECIRQIWSQTEGHTYEIVIVDNGSAPQDVARLRGLGRGIRLLELGCNRFFGEANNIAAEAARGRFVCLLNNDAFVRPGWLTPLVAAVTGDPQVGAAGPMLLFPDGTIQEAGAVVDAGGFPVRLGRGEPDGSPEHLRPRFVDYISAAALLVPRALFREAGGFDLAFEPAYYEDTDLCLELQALGRKVLFCPTSRVVHIEGASANGDAVAEARRKALGDLNREKFVSRWGDYLRTRDPGALASARGRLGAASSAEQGQVTAGALPTRTAVVHTPYAITPGGGERYLLTMAMALARRHRVTLVTPHRYSALRLRNIGRELGLDLSRLRLSTEEELFAAPPPDLMLTMSNHAVPGLPGRGRINLYHCQFPFPMARAPGIVEQALLESYDAVVVNSEYTRSHLHERVQAQGLPELPIEVLHPPVPQFEGDAAQKKRMILSVGRFFVGGHSKRQDLLIAAFKKIADRLDAPVELHLAGSSTPQGEHMDYLASLRASAEGYPITFHVNASPEVLRDLYRDAAVYWHGTGLGANLKKEPEKAEHFGISLVEAMSAQAVSFALDAGGPREILTSGQDGFLYRTVDDLSAMTLELLAGPPSRAVELGRAAGARARRFSPDGFMDRFEEIVARIEEGKLGRARPAVTTSSTQETTDDRSVVTRSAT